MSISVSRRQICSRRWQHCVPIFPQTRYLSFGFGDRHYLLDKDRGFGGMLAALWPGPGLMLVTGLASRCRRHSSDGNVIEIPVTAAHAADAQAFIWKSLAAERWRHRSTTRGTV
jgi:hypothetical protein